SFRRVTVTVSRADGPTHQFTFRPKAEGPREQLLIRDMHPMTGQRLDLWRLKHFFGTRLPAAPDTYLFHLQGRQNQTDERMIAMAEVRDATPELDADGKVVGLPELERTLTACLDGIRREQAGPEARRFDANRVVLYLWPVMTISLDRVQILADKIAPLTLGAGLEQIILMATFKESDDDEPRDVAVRFSYESGAGVVMSVTEPPAEPMQPVSSYTQKVQRSRRRGTVYPYELVPLLTGPVGTFVEHDLDENGTLVPVERPYGENTAGIITGVVTTPTPRYPEGMTRVALFGDDARALGLGDGAQRPGRSARATSPRSTWPSGSARPSNGSPCPRARPSRWSPAPRTWTGCPERCAASSTSPRPAARSTCWPPPSTSAPSRTGTPRPRYSCTPRATR